MSLHDEDGNELIDGHPHKAHAQIEIIPETTVEHREYKLKINAHAPFMNKKLYLTKTTLGLVNATKIINFEICGTEIIEFTNET